MKKYLLLWINAQQTSASLCALCVRIKFLCIPCILCATNNLCTCPKYVLLLFCQKNCVTLRPLCENKISVYSVHSVCQKICPSVLLSKKLRVPLRTLILCPLCEQIKFCVSPCILCAPKKYVLLFFCQKICVFRAFCVRLYHAVCGRTNRASLQPPIPSASFNP